MKLREQDHFKVNEINETLSKAQNRVNTILSYKEGVERYLALAKEEASKGKEGDRERYNFYIEHAKKCEGLLARYLK